MQLRKLATTPACDTKHEGKQILTSGKSHQERVLLKAARACYLWASIALVTFAYNFVVEGPHAVDAYSRSLESEHFAFVAGGRWYFLVGAIAFVLMGLRSVCKANGLHRSKP